MPETIFVFPKPPLVSDGPVIPSDCPVNIELVFLRRDIIRQIIAVNYYMKASRDLSGELSEVFRAEALDEAQHIILLMRMLAKLDPVQAQEFRQHDVELVITDPAPEKGNLEIDPDRRNAAISYLSKTVKLEAETINEYQEQIAASRNQEVIDLLCIIMNHEKEDLAIFSHYLFGVAPWGIK
jgi:rubrerythrin